MKILWIDDERLTIQSAKEFLEDNGHAVEIAANVQLAIEFTQCNSYDLILLDVMMPDSTHILNETEVKGGMTTGIALARELKRNNPSLKIVGCSIIKDEKTINWFIDYCNGYINKADIYLNPRLIEKLENIVNEKNQPNVFIVHGHDSGLLSELKNFLQNKLKLPEPIILREQPSLGKTIIEKFEHYSEDIDIVFVLLTPDDLVSKKKEEIRRARQNVIFELGYFFGKLQRKSGKIILIHKGNLELPSDISGITYLHTKDNINSITEAIRDELEGIM